jgi:hypothetical protein
MSLLAVAVVLAWAVIVVLALVQIGTLRQFTAMRADLRALRRDAEADLSVPVGQLRLSLPDAVLDDQRSVFALFASGTCKSCKKIVPEVARDDAIRGRAAVVIFVRSEDEATVVREYAGDVPIVVAADAFATLGVTGTPTGAVVDRSGIVLTAAPLRSVSGARTLLSQVDPTNERLKEPT